MAHGEGDEDEFISVGQLDVRRVVARLAGLAGLGPQLRAGWQRGATSNHTLAEPPGSLDVVTQVFGIGGIPEPSAVFTGVVRCLREGGTYYLADMHRPIQEFPCEWPFLHWRQMPLFEATTYAQTTIPLALARLWGWRDTTHDFYLAPLATIQEGDRWYGFEIVWFKQESERWWFGLPIMPIARLLLKKVAISDSDAASRQQLAEQIENLP